MDVLVADVLTNVKTHYDEGRYLAALQEGEQLGPLAKWPGVEGRILAGRLAHRLGGRRLGMLLHYLAWRENRSSAEAALWMVHAKVQRGRFLWAWFFLDEHEGLATPKSQVLADWQLAKATVLGILRDFERAEACLDAAQQIAPDNPWLWVVRSQVLVLEDQHDKALEAAQQALEIQPRYLPAVQATAHQLMTLNRDDEALNLLQSTVEVVECGDLLQQLGSLYADLRQYDEACRCLEAAERHLPILDAAQRTALAAQRADIAYLAGRFDEAAQLAAHVAPQFQDFFARGLQAPDDADRVLLNIPFVRQHEVTCAPATLAAVCAYWSVPAEHLEIAEEICYDGTPAHSQRKWAQQHGFHVREFRVTWETTVRLIDREIPYLLATAAPGMGHMQAVIGYDSRRKSFLIRDPMARRVVEYDAEALLQSQRRYGPRGMIMVPQDKVPAIEDIDLADAELYDQLHELFTELDRHDRYRAQEIVDDIATTYSDHDLLLDARRTLAAYDADTYESLTWIDQLLRRFPEDPNLLIQKLTYLTKLERRQERLALLHELSTREVTLPIYWLMYAQELIPDARATNMSRDLIRYAIRHQPTDGHAISTLALLHWNENERERACELYRFAACLNDRDEMACQSYFGVAQSLNQTDAALTFLKDRFQRFGSKSCWPAITLAQAYERLGRADLAIKTVEDARQLRPTDADLKLFAADILARHGRQAESRHTLLDAKGSSRRNQWLRRAAELARYDHSGPAALARWREVLEWEPTAVDAHEQVAQLLAASGDVQAAIYHLRQACRRFPRSIALHSLLLRWARNEGPEESEAIARHILEFQPVDAEARCELALAVAAQDRMSEAIALAEFAATAAPNNPHVHVVLAQLLSGVGDKPNADTHYRQALELDPDHVAAIGGFIQLAEDEGDAAKRLQYVADQFRQKPVNGQGLLAFYPWACSVAPPERVLSILREAHAARPDLWQTWIVLIRHMVSTGMVTDAVWLAQKAQEHFPLLQPIFVELARAQRAAGDYSAEKEILEQGLRISRDSAELTADLSRCLVRLGHPSDAKELLHAALSQEPYELLLRFAWCEWLWSQGQRDSALAELQTVIQDEGSSSPHWQTFLDWCKELSQHDRALQLAQELHPAAGAPLAQELTQLEPHNETWHVALARCLFRLGQWNECFQALQSGLQLHPQSVPLRDALAEAYGIWGRFDDALSACRQLPDEAELPIDLQIRVGAIIAARGELPDAFEQVYRTASSHSDHLAAWQFLASWWQYLPDPARGIEIATNLTRLAPEDANAWRFRGFVCRMSDKTDDAADAFQKALTLNPRDSLAGKELMDLHLLHNRIEAAAEVHEKIAPYLPYCDVLLGEIILAARRSNEQQAAEGLRELCKCQLAPPEALQSAYEANAAAGWAEQSREIMEGEIGRGMASLATRDVWIELMLQQHGLADLAADLDTRFSQPGVWELLAGSYLRRLGNIGRQDAAFLTRYIDDHRDRIRTSIETWASAGEALASCGLYRDVIEWFDNWQQQEFVMPATLTALLYSYLMVGQTHEAAELARAAETLPPDDGIFVHRLWLAALSTIDGDYESARALLPQIDPAVIEGIELYATLSQLTHCVVACHDASDQPTHSYSSTVAQLKSIRAASPLIDQNPVLGRLYLLLLRRVALDHGHGIAAAIAKLRSKFFRPKRELS